MLFKLYILETLHDNSLYQDLHIHTSFVDLDLFSRLQESLKITMKAVFSHFECEFFVVLFSVFTTLRGWGAVWKYQGKQCLICCISAVCLHLAWDSVNKVRNACSMGCLRHQCWLSIGGEVFIEKQHKRTYFHTLLPVSPISQRLVEKKKILSMTTCIINFFFYGMGFLLFSFVLVFFHFLLGLLSVVG